MEVFKLRKLVLTLGVYGERPNHRKYPFKVHGKFIPNKPLAISDERLRAEIVKLGELLHEFNVEQIVVNRTNFDDEIFM